MEGLATIRPGRRSWRPGFESPAAALVSKTLIRNSRSIRSSRNSLQTKEKTIYYPKQNSATPILLRSSRNRRFRLGILTRAPFLGLATPRAGAEFLRTEAF